MNASQAASARVARLRNFAIVAHINAGKTTLGERILFASGRQRFLGHVESGTATLDWLPEERERGISIGAAVTQVDWAGHRLHIVDTPGHVDFAAEVERSLRAADGAIVVLDGVRGVEPRTEAVWRRLDRLALPRLVFVNKLDRPVAELPRVLAELERRCGCRALPVTWPLHDPAGRLLRCVDLLMAPEETGADRDVAPDRREALFAALGEIDDEILARFVEGRHPGRAVLCRALRTALHARRLVPVFCGSALLGVGVDQLLDGVCELLPSPAECALAGPGDALAGLAIGAAGGSAASASPCLVRIFRGELTEGLHCEDGAGLVHRVTGLFAVHADELEPRSGAVAGEIVAVLAEPPFHAGDTLRALGTSLRLEPLQLASPVIAATLEPEASEELGALRSAAATVAAWDPTLHVDFDSERGELLVAGMGELHLDVFRDRLARSYGPRFSVGAPRVLRREVPGHEAQGTAELRRLVDGADAVAIAEITVIPAPGAGVEIRWGEAAADGSGLALRRELNAEVPVLARRGVRAAIPLDDLVIELRRLAVNAPPDAVGPLALEAVSFAFRRACLASDLRSEEPRVSFQVEVPRDSLGPVLAELQARGASIENLDAASTRCIIRGTGRLAALLGWATVLRSRTRGEGQCQLLPAGWVESPGA